MAVAEINSMNIRLEIVEAWIAGVQATSVTPDQFIKSDRELFINAIYPRIVNNGVGYRTDKKDNTDYEAFEIGDVIRHIDDVNKVSLVGRVLDEDLSLPADFYDETKIELYNQDKPAITI